MQGSFHNHAEHIEWTEVTSMSSLGSCELFDDLVASEANGDGQQSRLRRESGSLNQESQLELQSQLDSGTSDVVRQQLNMKNLTMHPHLC